MSRINGNQKGKRGEREAAKFLHELGFETARRSQQYAGGVDSADIHCEELDGVHIEVKFGYAKSTMDIGNAGLTKACQQAERDCGDKSWCVLWRPLRSGWRLTYGDDHGIHTAADERPLKTC